MSKNAGTERETALTTAGRVEGCRHDGVAAFVGIPYAASTEGTNRFRPPQPLAPWTGIRPAIAWGPRSYQTVAVNPFHEAYPHTFAAIAGDDLALDVPRSEDCLTLNVWTSDLSPTARHPVLVWLHGGGSCGSPSEYRADGSALVRRGDVVVVSVTHRLNVFGYLYLGSLAGDEYATSANIGHLDLIAALEWVRDNITTFGGDPDNVTLFGESAGGAKIACLMTMPRARPLFHRAVIQSGADTHRGLSTTLENAERFTAAMLRDLGIRDTDWPKLLRIPAEHLVLAHERVARELGLPYVLSPPGPTIDGVVLPNTPLDAVATDGCSDIPLIIGACRDETKLFLMDKDYLAPTTGRTASGRIAVGPLAQTGRAAFSQWLGPEADEIIAGYRESRPEASDEEIEAAIRGDRQFLVSSLRFAQARGSAGCSAPLFVYSFDWVSELLPELGAFHSTDIQFFFANTDRMPITSSDPSSSGLAAHMADALIAFARSGNPSHPGLPAWPAYDWHRRPTMVFERQCEVVDDPRPLERKAWDCVPTERVGF